MLHYLPDKCIKSEQIRIQRNIFVVLNCAKSYMKIKREFILTYFPSNVYV